MNLGEIIFMELVWRNIINAEAAVCFNKIYLELAILPKYTAIYIYILTLPSGTPTTNNYAFPVCY